MITSDEACLIAHEIAHSNERTLLRGRAGSGVTMIARRVGGYLPPMSDVERNWVAIEHDAAGLGPIHDRPFRAPHHTVSPAGLDGGIRLLRVITRAGEAHLARFGVLFLDELAEFTGGAIEALREALRRMGNTAPLLIASANHCPCGKRDVGTFSMNLVACTCSDHTVDQYNERVNGFALLLGLTKRKV